MRNSEKGKTPPAAFIVGSVALVFLIIGYQGALFIHRAAVTRIIANHDSPDTVFVFEALGDEYAAPPSGESVASASMLGGERSAPPSGKGVTSGLKPGQKGTEAYSRKGFSKASGSKAGGTNAGGPKSGGGSPVGPGSNGTHSEDDSRRIERRDAPHSEAARSIRLAHTEKTCESFPFDPNTASVETLMRLGFSLKQAQSIDNYRKKGGRFRRKEDFAKSYVVADSVYLRLERFIDIPKLDLNWADSTAFETLPGIGKFFASKMVSYRQELGGYSYPEQLMDIWNFDQEKYDKLRDLVWIDPKTIKPYPLWTLPEGDLAKHPYIDTHAAHGIVLFRQNNPESEWSVANLHKAGILDDSTADKLSRCRLR